MSPGPRRNFRNMAFHFLTPIFHFLSKLEPNARLVAYSMITYNSAQKTNFDKNPKNFLRQNAKTRLSLSKLSFDKKYWLNFLEFPFSRRHQRTKTRPDLLPKIFFPLPRYLASVCIWSDQILTPESKVIHLPASVNFLAHLPFTVSQQWGERTLGYPTDGCRVEGGSVGYPSTLSPHCQPIEKRRCARVGVFTGRWVLGAPRIGFRCRQFVKVADSRG